ncbi:MAG: transcriptional regulator NrdR [Lachnospiraceae bacterium]|jgi:transcriptional repressor NrdR|nr:transcriptional regulator NrdR [Lachnospiraceae bacterium]
MKCPYCGDENTRVIDSRSAEDGDSIRRRRQCDKCGKRFTTYEKIETIPVFVIKKDNTREPYDRAKIEKGIMLSCRKRPVKIEKITKMIDDIENTILNQDSKEVPSSFIGELIMEHLRNLDQVAYVRFASVYREFQDVDTFMKELQNILTRDKHEKEK